MHDRQPTPGQEGRMLIIPENGSAPFYAKVEMADNPLHEGTPLSKETLLQDATAALFGLTNTAVPDDVLAWLGKYNQHWWQRRTNIENGGYVAKEQTYSYFATFLVTYKQAATIMAAEAYTCDFTTGEITLVNPVTISTTTGSLTTAQINSLKGKYCTGLYSVPDKIVYLASDMEIQTGTNYVRLNDGYNTEVVSVFASDKLIGEWVYLRSSERTAYPDSGIVDGYEFRYLGIPFQNAVTAPKVAYGSYIGTGTNSASTPVTLTFDFSPKFVLIAPDSYMKYGDSSVHSEKYYVQIWMPGITKTLFYEYNGNSTRYMSVSGNTFSFYEIISGNGGNIGTLNASGKAYYYIAFGF